jgi:hypothetical protein
MSRIFCMFFSYPGTGIRAHDDQTNYMVQMAVYPDVSDLADTFFNIIYIRETR